MKRVFIFSIMLSMTFGCLPAFDNGLENFINENLAKNSTEIDFKTYSEVPWDRIYFLRPYTDENQLDSALSNDKRKISSTGISSDDSFTLVVLTHNNIVMQISKVKHTILNTERGAVLDDKKISRPLFRKDARFKVKTEDHMRYMMGPEY